MAAPTNVHVEAIDRGATRLRWSYGGANNIGIYRSTDGSSYSLIATVAAAVKQYDDEGLADKTKYWYKLSDDVGGTFSSVVTVVTYTVSSRRDKVNSSTLASRRARQPFASQKDFNELIEQLEQEVNVKNVEQTPCNLCLVDGALVIDCSSGCKWFAAVLTSDVNSISLIGCDDCPEVDFIIPPNVTRGICGWPIGCDYFGNECFEAPIAGGPNGRVAKTNGLTYDGYQQAPAPGLDSESCPCPSAATTLSLVCCTSCSITC